MMAKASQLAKAEAQTPWSPKAQETLCPYLKCAQEGPWTQACQDINYLDHVQGAFKKGTEVFIASMSLLA